MSLDNALVKTYHVPAELPLDDAARELAMVWGGSPKYPYGVWNVGRVQIGEREYGEMPAGTAPYAVGEHLFCAVCSRGEIGETFDEPSLSAHLVPREILALRDPNAEFRYIRDHYNQEVARLICKHPNLHPARGAIQYFWSMERTKRYLELAFGHQDNHSLLSMARIPIEWGLRTESRVVGWSILYGVPIDDWLGKLSNRDEVPPQIANPSSGKILYYDTVGRNVLATSTLPKGDWRREIYEKGLVTYAKLQQLKYLLPIFLLAEENQPIIFRTAVAAVGSGNDEGRSVRLFAGGFFEHITQVGRAVVDGKERAFYHLAGVRLHPRLVELTKKLPGAAQHVAGLQEIISTHRGSSAVKPQRRLVPIPALPPNMASGLVAEASGSDDIQRQTVHITSQEQAEDPVATQKDSAMGLSQLVKSVSERFNVDPEGAIRNAIIGVAQWALKGDDGEIRDSAQAVIDEVNDPNSAINTKLDRAIHDFGIWLKLYVPGLILSAGLSVLGLSETAFGFIDRYLGSSPSMLVKVLGNLEAASWLPIFTFIPIVPAGIVGVARATHMIYRAWRYNREDGKDIHFITKSARYISAILSTNDFGLIFTIFPGIIGKGSSLGPLIKKIGFSGIRRLIPKKSKKNKQEVEESTQEESTQE